MNDETILAIVQAENLRKQRTRERHARETLAQIGQSMCVSTTTIRKSKVIVNTFSDGESLLISGEARVNRLYKLAKGDDRVGLHILLPFELRERIKENALERGQTVNDMLNETLTKIFW